MNQLLDYIATQAEAVLNYNAGNMKLMAHSDASYLSDPKTRSKVGGHFPSRLIQLYLTIMMQFLTLHIYIIKHVMTSATDAEFATLYIIARVPVYFRIILEDMRHKQPRTPLQTENAMAEAVTNGKL